MAQRSATKSSSKRRSSAKVPTRSSKTRTTTGSKVSRKKRVANCRSGSDAAEPAAGDREVTIDRRRAEARFTEETAATPAAAAPKLERRKKVTRRRQIDPTTCERDYTDDEVEFMNAIDDYKRQSGRMFPTCSEVLEVVRGLGYVKLSAAQIVANHENAPAAAAAPVAWPIEATATATAVI